MKVGEVGLNRDVGGDDWEGWCRVGDCMCVCVCVFVWVDVCLNDGGSGFSEVCQSNVHEHQFTRRTSISEHHGHSFFHRPLATIRPT